MANGNCQLAKTGDRQKMFISQWFNRRNDRLGPLWKGRDKSALVEADEEALMTMSAYIDLTPVRAGMVSRPEDYRWWLYQEGEEVTADPTLGQSGRKGFNREEVEKGSAKEGRISLSEKLSCRVRYLTSGAVIGSAAFVDQIFANNR